MSPIRIVYEPDNSCGRIPHASKPRSLLTGREIVVPSRHASDYRKQLEPHKPFSERLEIPNDLSSNLTPKGFLRVNCSSPSSLHPSTFTDRFQKSMYGSLDNVRYEKLVGELKVAKRLWEDHDFPANHNSLGRLNLQEQVEWRRPLEINRKAEFFIDNYDRFDIKQGKLGDCWLLAVISSVATYPTLFDQVCPPGQSIRSPSYVGAFRFRFWHFGQWKEVVVDDRLPVIAGTNRLLFMHSTNQDEMWSALMEKAYAKLYGSYASLRGGTQAEAMEDLTGGLCETIHVEHAPANLTSTLFRYADQCCLMGCSIESKVVEGRLGNGLVTSHAYSITGIQEIHFRGRQQCLLRIRNPWGNHVEWNGAFSDHSQEWNYVDERTRRAMEVKFQHDGEFWMTLEEFLASFTIIEVCHLGMESLMAHETIAGKHRMQEFVYTGEWQANINAGGCANNMDTFWSNPQYRIKVNDVDPNDPNDLCSLYIGLMQIDMRRLGKDLLPIGFVLYQLGNEELDALKGRDFFITNRMIARSEFIDTREVMAKFLLPPGNYLVVPSTFEPNEEAKFMLRVFTQVRIGHDALDVQNEQLGVDKSLIMEMQTFHDASNEDRIMQQKFDEHKDEHGDIGPAQLSTMLNTSSFMRVRGFTGFSEDLCRCLVACVDDDQSGSLLFGEFMELWESLEMWRFIFQKFDVDGNGLLNVIELREAISHSGFRVSNKVYASLVNRYADHDKSTITFEQFLLCLVRLKAAFENYEAQPKNLEGECLFNKEDYLRITMYT